MGRSERVCARNSGCRNAALPAIAKRLPWRAFGQMAGRYSGVIAFAGCIVGLPVPSAAIRSEWKRTAESDIPNFKLIEFQGAQPFEFDARMFR